MQQAAGLVPQFAGQAPYVPSSAQVSAQVAAQGAAQLQSMMAVSQLGQQPLGPFGSPMFPQLQTPFVGQPGMMPGPGGSYYQMTPAGAPSPYSGAGYGRQDVAGQMTAPGSPYMPSAPMPSSIYRGAMGQPNMAPFSPPPPPAMFDTPYQAGITQAYATSDRRFGGAMTDMGIGARLGMDAGMGMIGANIGRQYGGTRGAMVGGALGFLGSEISGLGNGAQNSFMENIALPPMNTRAYGTGLERMSRGFVSGGPELGPTGNGWSRSAAMSAASGLQDLAQNDGFQRDTGNRFNTADVMRIAQGSGQEGLLAGVQTGADMKGRVREISKSLTAVMELANEPDVMRAIQVMGQMKSSGLSLGETRQAVQNGRTFARMAGDSFEGLSSTAGATGSSAFQSLGLSQGLGMNTGMANAGIAIASQNSGGLSSQVLNMLGGAHGLAGMNTMFSAGMLQMPMMAPGMMNAQGGIDVGAMRQMMSGQMGAFGMTSRGANTMGQMGREMGVGGLGMALAMQPVLQDTIGRMVQSQGPFAQRHMEDRQMLSLMRNMGLHGSEGLMTSAQMMGMSGTEAMARAQEMGDPQHYERERQQIEVNRRERRGEELRAKEAEEPGFVDEMESRYGAAAGIGRFGRSIIRGFRRASREMVGAETAAYYAPSTRDELRRNRTAVRDASYLEGGGGATESEGLDTYLDRARGIGEMHGGRGLVATVGGVLRGNSVSEARAYRETGRFLSTGLHANNQTYAAATERVGETFGSSEALGTYSESIANMYGARRGTLGGLVGGLANLTVSVGASHLSNNILDVGNVSGTSVNTLDEYRQRYVQQQAGRLGGAEAAGRAFDAERSTISIQTMRRARGMMTLEERAKQDSDQRAASDITVGGRQRSPEMAERDAYRPLMGRYADIVDSRRHVDALLHFDGIGDTDAKRDASTDYMTSRAMLQVQMQAETDPRRRDALRHQIDQLHQEGARRGIDIDRANSRVDARSSELMGDGDLRDSLRGANLGGTSAEILATVHGARGRIEGATRTSRRNDAIRSLANQDGVLGSGFAGVAQADGSVDVGRMRGQIEAIAGNEGQMRELAATHPELAAAYRRVASGNARESAAGMADVNSQIDGFGTRAAQLRTEFREKGWSGRAWDRVRNGGFSLNPFAPVVNAIRGASQTEQGYVDQRMTAGTVSDADASRQTSDVTSMASQALGAGVGGGGDRLIQAGDRLLQAAEALNNFAGNQTMDGIFPHARTP